MFGDDVVAVAVVAPKPTGSLGRERVLASMTLRSISSYLTDTVITFLVATTRQTQ